MRGYADAEIKNAARLIDGKITGFITSGDEDWGFQVNVNGKVFNVWVDRDPEGNGPGHLNIEPAKAPAS